MLIVAGDDYIITMDLHASQVQGFFIIAGCGQVDQGEHPNLQGGGYSRVSGCSRSKEGDLYCCPAKH